MKLPHILITAGGSLPSAAALAHGVHAEVPHEGLLHLLTHNWPLLPMAAILIGGYFMLRGRDRR